MGRLILLMTLLSGCALEVGPAEANCSQIRRAYQYAWNMCYPDGLHPKTSGCRAGLILYYQDFHECFE